MTPKQLDVLGIESKWLAPLTAAFLKYNIDTPDRQAAFIGQCIVESDNFRHVEENLDYSVQRLMEVWPSRFPNEEAAKPYAHNPEKLGDKVYGGRLGNTEDGDGYAYRGRGLIQLTGKDAYTYCGNALGINLVAFPQFLAEPEFAALSAGWFWNKKNLNDLADKHDYTEMTRRINGGMTALRERGAAIGKAKAVFGA